MPLRLDSLFHTLDRFEERIPLDVLRRELEDLTVEYDDIAAFAAFGDRHYRRNLMHAGRCYQALILCWRSGQRSPIHDHRGSSCGVRVIRGVATETTFQRSANGMVVPTHSREMREGQVCATQDEDIHQMSNLQPAGRDLVTLHIYSPALLTMRTFSLSDGTVREWADPVFEFTAGAGI